MIRAPTITILVWLLVTACGNGGTHNGSFQPASVTLTESGDLKELQDEQLVFIDGEGETWTAPKGTLTDGASVPRLALPITDGRWDSTFLKAAVVHDAYCQEENKDRTPNQYRRKPWQSVHRMFYEAMIAGDTDTITAKLMFAAVWLAGPRWDDPTTDHESLSQRSLVRGFAGYPQWIEADNPSLDAIVENLDRRQNALISLDDLESRITSAISAKDYDQVEQLLTRQQEQIRHEFERLPDDAMVRLYVGSYHNQRAHYFQQVDQQQLANSELQKAELSFNQVNQVDPQNPSAKIGLSRAVQLRGDNRRGLELLREAEAAAPQLLYLQENRRLVEMQVRPDIHPISEREISIEEEQVHDQ